MIQLYAPAITGNHYSLDEQETRHAVQVMRSKVGDRVMLLDGAGGIYTGILETINRKNCDIAIEDKKEVPRRKLHLHLAIAPTKLNDRMEWFLEKATEIGVEEITPVICDRSERREVNHERFQKVLIAAMKQSMNPWLPVLNQQATFKKFLSQTDPGCIAHCVDSEKTPLKNVELKDAKITVLIGPEGDFTEGEIQMAVQHKWIPVSLGSTRLRTETAGIVACHTITLLNP